MDKLKTGDLLLFNYQAHGPMGWFTKMIKWGSHSDYTHTAMVLKDPTFIHPSLKGTYVITDAVVRYKLNKVQPYDSLSFKEYPFSYDLIGEKVCVYLDLLKTENCDC